jgi:hypothetical protein
MSAVAPNPQTETGVGGAAPPIAGDDFSQYALPQNMTLPSGPPPGAPVDSTYLAANAQNRANIAAQYAAALKAMGYTDPTTGAFIPGDLINAANLSEGQQWQGMQQADLANTQAMQQAGTLFSGVRGQQQAEAETPFRQAIAQTELQLPEDLAAQYQTASGLVGAYNTQDMSDLAAAAQRATQSIDTSPPATAPAPAPAAPAPAPTPPPTSQASDYWATPAYVRGGPAAYMAAGGEVNQPTNAIIGERGPEVVIPRSNLDPVGNAALDRVAQAAGVPTDGGGIIQPPRSPIAPGDTLPSINMGPPPGIHSFGPPVGGHLPIPGPPIHPAQALQDLGRHAAAVQLYLQHHPGAVAGHATGIPHWAQAAVAARLRASIPQHAFAAV